VPAETAEEARATAIELFPEGFEERDAPGGVELVLYADEARETELRARFGAVTVNEVEEGWETRWRSFHRGVRVGSLWVGPEWEKPPDDAAAIVIDPGQAFGTGAHATTRLCLELLTRLPGGALLDVGCGSGVLAIAGARLGYTPVTAIDVDPHAVEATVRNAEVNGVSLDIRLADGLSGTLPEAGTAVANLTLDTVLDLALRLRSPRFVSSGYLAGNDPVVAGFERSERLEADGWAADLWIRQAQ
jgi:ribosomal protein L11 methyltransferase